MVFVFILIYFLIFFLYKCFAILLLKNHILEALNFTLVMSLGSKVGYKSLLCKTIFLNLIFFFLEPTP